MALSPRPATEHRAPSSTSWRPLALLAASLIAASVGAACSGGDDTQGPGPGSPDPSCTDGSQNGDESDVDCGGSCDPCSLDGACGDGDDCASSWCSPEQRCGCEPGTEPDGASGCVEIDDCDPNPCANGGTCTDGSQSYACSCPQGFTGDTCETDVDDCAGMPCVNGACTDEVDGYSCSCDDGFFGDNCDTTCDATGTDCLVVDSCEQQGGAPLSCSGCEDGFHGGTCDDACDATGTDCTAVVSCDQQTGAPSACSDCAAGLYGATCMDDCDSATNDCVDVLTCDAMSGAPLTCAGCDPAYTGTDCGGACSASGTQCLLVNACDQGTGAATACAGCNAGFFDATCSSGCSTMGTNCVAVNACDQGTGAATACAGCNAGFFDATCSSGCSTMGTNCMAVNACDQGTGAATACTGCNAGFFDATCSSNCAPIANCAVATTCDQATGANPQCGTCATGFYGAACDQAGLIGALTPGDPGTWADGTKASSCLVYLNPPAGYTYQGSTGDGSYTLDINGNDVVALCNMDDATLGGGWTRIEPCMALNDLAGLLEITFGAVDESSFDANCRPRTVRSGGHWAQYTFDFPGTFSEFYMESFEISSYNIIGGHTSDVGGYDHVAGGVWIPPSLPTAWGDLTYGSAADVGPVVGFAQLGANHSSENTVHPWPGPPATSYAVGATSTQFRMSWGEQGGQSEGWYPWYGGFIWLR
jgi:EGF-like domain/Human growth factor-like EGF